MEGNPRNPYLKNHYPICSVNTPKVLSFGIQGNDKFFIMAENHRVHQYQRNLNNRKCHLVAELNIKEIQRLDFPREDFSVSVLSEKYAIYKDMIFYFYEREPFPPGVFEAERLIQQAQNNDRKLYLKGPFTFTGNNRFYNVLRQRKFKTFIRIFNLPDKTQRTLVNDFSNYVDMSTFLPGGQILLRCRRRFLIFSSDGNFIDEVKFNDEALLNAPPSETENALKDKQD